MSNLDEKQFEELTADMDDVRNLLILIASKLGAKSEEIGKVLGVRGGRPRQILTGAHRKKRPPR